MEEVPSLQTSHPQELSPRDGMQTSVRGEIFFFGVRWRRSAFFQRKSIIVEDVAPYEVTTLREAHSPLIIRRVGGLSAGCVL